MAVLAPEKLAHLEGLPRYTPGAHGKSAKSIVLSANENPYGAAPSAIKLLSTLQNAHRYPPGHYPLLREKLAQRHRLKPEQLTIGCGSDELINMLARAYVGQTDSIVMTKHGFLIYEIAARAIGAKIIKAAETPTKEGGFKLDPHAVLDVVDRNTKIVFLANPNNPTGNYWNADTLQHFRAALNPEVLLVVDSAYAEYSTPNPHYSDGMALARSTPNTVMLRTFSKIYGLASLRVGWMLASPDIIDTINQLKPPFNVNGFGYRAATEALDDKAWIENCVAKNSKQRALLRAGLQKLGLRVPEGEGNFVLAGFPSAAAADIGLRALAQENIFVRDLKPYRLPDRLRITVGSPTENQSLLGALRRARASWERT